MFLSSCSSEVKHYKCEDERENCLTMPILAGKGKNNVELSILTDWRYPLIESDHPTLFIKYVSKPSLINNIKHFDVKLLVDGKEIEPDNEEFKATYITHTSNEVTFEKKHCCINLGEKLSVNIAPKDVNHSDTFHTVEVLVMKDYKSLKSLPKKMKVILTATSDKETMEMERIVILTSHQSSGFIKFH